MLETIKNKGEQADDRREFHFGRTPNDTDSHANSRGLDHKG